MEPTRRALPAKPISAFLEGIGYTRRAFRLIRGDRALLRYAVLPFLINLAVFGLAIAAFVYWFGDLWHLASAWTESARPEAWYWLPLYWLLAMVRWLIAAVLVVVAVLILWISFTLVGNVIAAPFNKLLSAATERSLGSVEEAGAEGGWRALLGEMARALSDETRKMGFFLLIQAALLPLNLVPLVGTIAYATLSLGFGALFVALEFTDYPMARRRIPFAERRRTVWRHRAVMSGFGGSLFLTFLVPGLNLLLLPLGVVGGTILYLDVAGAAPPPAPLAAPQPDRAERPAGPPRTP
ncbi:MAG: EI24 domain-containing protein [Deltaproteobacteria bacterium]|nr:EI24 domain-containing protein [Deltaproteobacteria bacterium]